MRTILKMRETEKPNRLVFNEEPVEKKHILVEDLTPVLLGAYNISGFCPPRVLWDLLSGVFKPVQTENVAQTVTKQVEMCSNSETGNEPVQLMACSGGKADRSLIQGENKVGMLFNVSTHNSSILSRSEIMVPHVSETLSTGNYLDILSRTITFLELARKETVLSSFEKTHFPLVYMTCDMLPLFPPGGSLRFLSNQTKLKPVNKQNWYYSPGIFLSFPMLALVRLIVKDDTGEPFKDVDIDTCHDTLEDLYAYGRNALEAPAAVNNDVSGLPCSDDIDLIYVTKY